MQTGVWFNSRKPKQTGVWFNSRKPKPRLCQGLAPPSVKPCGSAPGHLSRRTPKGSHRLRPLAVPPTSLWAGPSPSPSPPPPPQGGASRRWLGAGPGGTGRSVGSRRVAGWLGCWHGCVLVSAERARGRCHHAQGCVCRPAVPAGARSAGVEQK